MHRQKNIHMQNNVTTSDVIHFTDILGSLWRSRGIVLITTLLVVVCGFVGSLYFAQYRSEGFFQFGGAIPAMKERENEKEKEPSAGIALSDFKRYAASYATGERFADFVQDKKVGVTDGIDNLSATFASRDGITKLIEPIYPFTKLDAKELMDQPKDSNNNIIGIRINYTSHSPESAQQMVGLLGRYVMDSIIYSIYSDELKFKHSEIVAKMIKLDNVIIKNKELIEKYSRNGMDLKQIVGRYPGSLNQSSRQVVTVTEENARYLSPVSLLASTEVQASEAREAIRKAKREQRQSMLWLEYFDNVKTLLDSTKSGGVLLQGLEQVKEVTFKNKSLEDETIKQVYNTITIDNQNAINTYLEKSRFIAGPTLPTYSSLRPKIVLAISLFMGFFLSVLIVYMRNWWRDNWPSVSG